ncbi:hypothetical protein LJC32_02030 [Oscillospiraceae bacterium OttesenSCG-928-F05]|nr:hypothetical protein [Oscillospiraceae bacterium OttesenSCG-928-F05]
MKRFYFEQHATWMRLGVQTVTCRPGRVVVETKRVSGCTESGQFKLTGYCKTRFVYLSHDAGAAWPESEPSKGKRGGRAA